MNTPNKDDVRRFTVDSMHRKTNISKAKCCILYELFFRDYKQKLAELINEELLGKINTNENYQRAGGVIAESICEKYELEWSGSA